MSCFESVEEISTDYCSECVHAGESECHWCRDDTPSGVPSQFETKRDYFARICFEDDYLEDD